MTITAQTSAQIKNAVSKIFKTNKRDLQTDTSEEGVAVLEAINTFLELSAPSFSDLITLREAIYTYQDQESLGIRLYKASSDVQGVVKSLIAEKQFGYTELNENLAYEGDGDASVVTISSAIGSDALTTGNNTIISGINELDEEIGVIRSTLTITPRSGAYLNKCTMDNEGVYTVGGSVFIGFDPEGDGILLSSMEGLNTLTGYINAMAQCATWQLTYEDQDLCVTTTHAGGTTGTGEATGCSPALDFASAGAYCLSVFDNFDYV
jgi:hypothetical protein